MIYPIPFIEYDKKHLIKLLDVKKQINPWTGYIQQRLGTVNLAERLKLNLPFPISFAEFIITPRWASIGPHTDHKRLCGLNIPIKNEGWTKFYLPGENKNIAPSKTVNKEVATSYEDAKEIFSVKYHTPVIIDNTKIHGVHNTSDNPRVVLACTIGKPNDPYNFERVMEIIKNENFNWV